jgi:predicted DNA-binding protein (MmcQ/YjbR family)
MAHPRTYSERDRHLKQLRAVCLALPEASEEEAWGRPTFRAGKKIFALFAVSPDEELAVVFKPEPGERPALVADDRFYVPKYWGPSGWLGFAFDRAPVDWDEVAELVEGSYRQVALKRMLKALDERA